MSRGGTKVVLFAYHLQQRGAQAFAKVKAIVDINSAKQGKWAPVSRLPILSPFKAAKVSSGRCIIVVMNPNYLDGIAQQAVQCGLNAAYVFGV